MEACSPSVLQMKPGPGLRQWQSYIEAQRPAGLAHSRLLPGSSFTLGKHAGGAAEQLFMLSRQLQDNMANNNNNNNVGGVDNGGVKLGRMRSDSLSSMRPSPTVGRPPAAHSPQLSELPAGRRIMANYSTSSLPRRFPPPAAQDGSRAAAPSSVEQPLLKLWPPGEAAAAAWR